LAANGESQSQAGKLFTQGLSELFKDIFFFVELFKRIPFSLGSIK
jgi:hypothetical protein